MLCRIGHWLPIITICPVNKLPDVIYCYVTVDGFAELYAVRKKLFRGFFLKQMFMEEVVDEILERAKDLPVTKVELILLTGRHKIEVET